MKNILLTTLYLNCQFPALGSSIDFTSSLISKLFVIIDFNKFRLSFKINSFFMIKKDYFLEIINLLIVIKRVSTVQMQRDNWPECFYHLYTLSQQC